MDDNLLTTVSQGGNNRHTCCYLQVNIFPNAVFLFQRDLEVNNLPKCRVSVSTPSNEP